MKMNYLFSNQYCVGYIAVNKAFGESKEGDNFRNIVDRKGKAIPAYYSIVENIYQVHDAM